MRKFLVIGYYPDEDGQRCADSIETTDPRRAEEWFTSEYPGVVVAGVVALDAKGEMEVVS